MRSVILQVLDRIFKSGVNCDVKNFENFSERRKSATWSVNGETVFYKRLSTREVLHVSPQTRDCTSAPAYSPHLSVSPPPFSDEPSRDLILGDNTGQWPSVD